MNVLNFNQRIFQNFIENNKLVSLLILISFFSSLRVFILPLFGDEITYSKIAENIMLHGKYFFNGKPSTITPSVPFILAFFYTKFDPSVGYVLARLLNLLFIFIGMRYLYLFLKKNQLQHGVVWAILLLTAVNNNFVIWSLALYPEAILFCFFWAFIYYLTEPLKEPKEILYILVPFIALVITRYVYAVLGIFVVYFIYNYLKSRNKEKNIGHLTKVLIYSILCFVPLLFWFKYVYNLEKEVDTGLSYFSRFENNSWIYNIKAGIGIIKHENVDNINGIPAFISLFLPITGFRNWILSVLLLTFFVLGFIFRGKARSHKILFSAILLVMLGLIFAGTGFSRYWLIMLPGFLLGFYFFFKCLKIKDSLFVLLAQIAAVIYVLNELRLDIKILNNFF